MDSSARILQLGEVVRFGNGKAIKRAQKDATRSTAQTESSAVAFAKMASSSADWRFAVP